MAFKAGFKIGSIGPRIRAAAGKAAKATRAVLKTPLGRGVALAVVIAGAAYGWLAFEAGDTLKALDAANPPGVAQLADPAKPDAAPAPEKQAAAAAPAPVPAAPPAAKPGAPLPDLIDHTPVGDLPRIGTDGTMAWRAYAAQAPDAGDKPRIAILVSGLGVSAAVDDHAINDLPPAVSLAFLSFSDRIKPLVVKARTHGHEVVLATPMEPEAYPADDPGPQTLLVKSAPAENVARLDWHLARTDSYIGIAPTMGSRFTASPEPLQPILTELAKRGLMYVDTGSAVFGAAPALAKTAGVPIAIADRAIDRVPTKGAIDHELADLETLARRRGWAFGLATAYPSSFDRLIAWAATLEAKGIVLVPVSAIAQPPAAVGQGVGQGGSLQRPAAALAREGP